MELEGLNFYLDGVTNFTFCLIGMTVNAAAIGMLCRQKTTSIFVKLMISLVTYDLIYVFLSATCFSLPRLSTTFDGKKTDAFFHSIPNSFHVFVFFFFHPLGKKIFQNLIFFHRDERKFIFLLCRANFFLNLNFKILKVVLEAAEAVEATI